MSQQGKMKTNFSGLLYITKYWKFSCVLHAHSQFLCSRVANLFFLKPDFEILVFWTPLAFLEIKKLHIHYKSLATRVYYHAGCTEYCKHFTVAPKMIYDVIDKKQMHDSAITGKEYTSKDWTCVISMFLTSFNVYFVCGCACFICICLKTAIWLFWLIGTRSVFFWWRQVGNPVV